jgi:hypothetical protein
MAANYEYAELVFDSKDCTTTSQPGFVVTDTPLFYLFNSWENITKIKVLEAQIPTSYYLFNSLNNIIELVELTAGVVTNTYTVTIPEGNYNSTTIQTVLAAALNASGTANTYTVTYSNSTMKLSVSSNAAGATQSFFFYDYQGVDDITLVDQTCLRFLGVERGTSAPYYVSALSSEQALPSLTFTNVAELSGPDYLYICSRKLGPLMDMDLPTNGLVNKVGQSTSGLQICKVPLVNDIGTVANWQDPAPERWFDFGGTNLQGTIDFYCTLGTDTQKYPIQFNGVGFSLKLGLLMYPREEQQLLNGGIQNQRVVSRTTR